MLFALSWVAVFWAIGLYRLRVRWGLLAEARDVLRGTILVLALTLSLLFLFHQDDVSRLFLVLLFAAQFLVALGGRALLRRWFESLRRRGRDTSYMLIIGTGPLAQAFADQLEASPCAGHAGHRSSGVPRRMRVPMRRSRGRSSATVEELHACSAPSHRRGGRVPAADRVRLPRPDHHGRGRRGQDCTRSARPTEGVLVGALQEEFEGFLVQSVVHDGQRELERALKRVVDVVGADRAGHPEPAVRGTAAAIWIRDGRPILFRQVRIGRHGRPFTIYKFRTMVCDAEDRYAEVAALSDTKGAAFKMENDPRVTASGAFSASGPSTSCRS